MKISKIKLDNFKNYHSASIDFDDQFNMIVGLNGRGKTNLMDAIYFLCIGKSYFQRQDKNVIRIGSGFLRLEGHFNRLNKSIKMVLKIKDKKKDFLKNGKKYNRLMDHLGLLPVIMICPRDIELFYEGSLERRRFIDYTLSQLDKEYTTALIEYNRVLKQRNASLKFFAKSGRQDHNLINSYDNSLSKSSAVIYEKRRQFVLDLEPIFNKTYALISSGAEKCKIRYRSQLESSELSHLLKSNLEKDLILQRTTQGIHKDDIVFEMNGVKLKNFGSQGQLKSFVLALKLAQFHVLYEHTGVKPLLLLDDLFDKLDEQRIKELLNILGGEPFGQIFLTDTKETLLKELFLELKLDYNCIKVNSDLTGSPNLEGSYEEE